MQDNLARVLEEENYELLKEQQIQHTQKKQRRNRRSRLGAIFLTAIIFLAGMTVILRYMQVYELERQILKVQDSLNLLQTENNQKEITLNNSMSNEELEDAALNRLGMNKPASNQVVYVTVEKSDNAEIIAPEEEEQSFIGMLVQGTKDFFGIFTSK